MSITLSADTLQDDIALSLACAMAAANRKAREFGVEAEQSLLTITQETFDDKPVWRINYGSKDYIGRRGGDLIIEVNSLDGTIERAFRGQ